MRSALSTRAAASVMPVLFDTGRKPSASRLVFGPPEEREVFNLSAGVRSTSIVSLLRDAADAVIDIIVDLVVTACGASPTNRVVDQPDDLK